MGRIQFITKPESEQDDAKTILRIEADAGGWATLRTLVVEVAGSGDGASRKLDGAEVWMDGERIQVFLATVEKVEPIRRRKMTRDVLIALGIIVLCLLIVAGAFVFGEKKHQGPSPVPVEKR